MPAYRAVLFDFFGTLTHAVTRGDGHHAVAELLGCTPDSLATALDETYFLRASGRLGDAADCLRRVCDQAGVRPTEPALHAAVRARRAAVRDDTRLRADAVATLRALRARGLLTGVISDCTHEVPDLLAELPVAPLLDTRVFSVEVGRCKPDPAIFLRACGMLGVEPERTLMVGDSAADAGAARVGCATLVLPAARAGPAPSGDPGEAGPPGAAGAPVPTRDPGALYPASHTGATADWLREHGSRGQAVHGLAWKPSRIDQRERHVVLREQREHLGIVLRSGEHLLSLIDWRAKVASSSWSHAFLTEKNHWIYPDLDADRTRIRASQF